jgi:hypothetical protein
MNPCLGFQCIQCINTTNCGWVSYSIPGFCAIGGNKICPYQSEEDELAWKIFVYVLLVIVLIFVFFCVVKLWFKLNKMYDNVIGIRYMRVPLDEF